MLLPRSLGPELERLSSAMSAAYSCRPITPGALVVLPRRPAAVRLSQLPAAEVDDLFATAGAACAAAEREGGCDGFNWAMKDSWSLSGSPGPEQLHLHIVPRAAPTEPAMFCRDFRENDSVCVPAQQVPVRLPFCLRLSDTATFRLEQVRAD
jgi:diadenosine tetraphosphate (Ap4A) HIT family hydrolase